MPSDGSITTSGLFNSAGITMLPEFETLATSEGGEGSYTGPLWQVQELHLKFGRKPSYAIVYIPLAAVSDETAPTVAAVASSPINGIKHGDFCKVVGQFTGLTGNLFSGSVMNISYNIRPDTACIMIQDHRWLLEGLWVVGQFHIDGTTSEKFLDGERCHMNPGGEPNCTKGSAGQPVFCPRNWGLAVGEAVPETLTSGKATYWTVTLALAYMQWVFANSAAASGLSAFPWFSQIPSCINWEAGYISGVVDSNAGERKSREMDWDGQRLLDVLSDLAEMAGHYALYMKPTSDFQQTLMIVKTQYDSSGPATAITTRATGGDASVTFSQPVAIEGSVEEDATELYTKVVVAGDLVYIERRLEEYGALGLIPAWSAQDFTDWKALINAGISTASPAITAKTRKAFDAACLKYPRVLQTWRIDPAFNFQASTSQSGFPLSNRSDRIPLPHLLTSYTEDPNPTTASGKTFVKVDIKLEIKNGSDYIFFQDPEGLRMDLDGTIWAPGLIFPSGLNSTTNSSWEGTISTPNSITARTIRATFAIPCDHRLTSAVKINSDPTLSMQNVVQTDDSEKISSHLSRMFYADAAELHKLLIRQDAYPLPETLNGTAKSDTLRDDSDLIEAHAKRRLADLGRVRRTGRLLYPHIYPVAEPGHMVMELKGVGGSGGSFPLRACCTEVVFRANGKTNTTELIFG